MQPTIFTQIASFFTPVHRDGHKFIALAAAAAVLLFLVWSVLGVIAAIITAALAFFFRDPERVIPFDESLVLAPADGKVLKIANAIPPSELGLGTEPLPCVSIFLSLFDVHINRAPVSGSIIASVHRDGTHHHANAVEAQSENERHGYIIENAGGLKIGVVLVAGYVARRIVPLVRHGDTVSAGDRIGLIRFGSRVDVYLSQGQGFLAAEGQKMVAGETVIADLTVQASPRRFKKS